MNSKTPKFLQVLRVLVLPLLISGSVPAQVAGNTPSGDGAAASAPDVPGNAADASLQLAIARAVLVAFPPLGQDRTLPPDQAQEHPQAQAPPATKPTEPSLPDLGFPPNQTQGNPQEQARLDKRSHMLKIHQRLGLITAAPLLATVLTGGLAGGRSTSSTNRDLHAALGSVTAGLYLTTAYFAVFAPKIQ
jgi:hypothetical protein